MVATLVRTNTETRSRVSGVLQLAVASPHARTSRTLAFGISRQVGVKSLNYELVARPKLDKAVYWSPSQPLQRCAPLTPSLWTSNSKLFTPHS